MHAKCDGIDIKIQNNLPRRHQIYMIRIFCSVPTVKIASDMYTNDTTNGFCVDSVNVFHVWQRIYTRLPGGSPCFKMVIYTAAVQEAQPNRLYTQLSGVNRAETPNFFSHRRPL